MKKSNAVENLLRRALDEKTHVVIKRGIKKADQIRGYVLAIDQSWMLMAKTRDGGYPDGFTVLRVPDIKKCEKTVPLRHSSCGTLISGHLPDHP